MEGRDPVPLNTRENSSYVICRTPPILENVQAKLARGIDVWVKHLANELDGGWLVRVLLFELHYKSEGSILEWGICRANNDRIPV